MRLLCFKHVPFEGPAAFSEWAAQRGHELTSVEVYAGEALPGPEDYDLLLVMGGPMNIYEEAEHPWLAAEKAAIRAAIKTGKYLVGVCLGGQLIADQLGGPVSRGDASEIGWWQVYRQSDCPPGLPLPEELRVYHWHGDCFQLPPGARSLLASEACALQAFLFEDRILGFQCHLETTRESMEALIAACGDEIGSGPFVQDVATMQAEPESTYQRMQGVLFELLDTLTRDA